MGIQKIREKYGKNLKGRQALNAAVRAEIIGGNAILDATQATHAFLAKRASEHGEWAGRVQQAHDLLEGVAVEMRDAVLARYKESDE